MVPQRAKKVKLVGMINVFTVDLYSEIYTCWRSCVFDC